MEVKVVLLVILMIFCQWSLGARRGKCNKCEVRIKELEQEIKKLTAGKKVPEPSVGARVYARWTNGLYYPGVIDSGTVQSWHIQYDDGDQTYLSKTNSKAIVMDVVLPLTNVATGTEVIAWWPNRIKYYPGRVDKTEGGRYYIQYDDGDAGWVARHQLRVYSSPSIPA